MVAETLPAPEVAPESLTDAPVRLNADGSVRKKPGPKPGQKRTPRRAPAPGLRPPAAPRKPSSVDYRPALLGLAQIPQLILGVAAKFAKTDETRAALALDSMTVGIHAAPVAEAVNTTAQTDERLAKLCDKLATVGPYSLVVSAVLVPVAQCMANHNVIPANEAMGILPPPRLVALAESMAG